MKSYSFDDCKNLLMLNFIFIIFSVEEKINDNNSNSNNRSKIKTKVIKILIFLFNPLNSHDRARIPINVTTLSGYVEYVK